MANLCIKTPSSASLVLIFQLLVLRPRPNAHGAHVRGTKESWGDQKAGWLFLYLFSVKLAGLFSNKCIRTELEYMQLWREGIEHRSRALIVYLISNWGWKHKIRIFVTCWMCRKLRAFGGDQTDPKFVWGTKFNFKDWAALSQGQKLPGFQLDPTPSSLGTCPVHPTEHQPAHHHLWVTIQGKELLAQVRGHLPGRFNLRDAERHQ